ncbi:MAG: glutathione S-transferase family protein [Pseudomonas sp.]|uniref:glutathione S-transferase family protein n=1 Tax=Pseudomonas sp. TaxID=306 RepID=UPI003D150B77
MQLLLNKTSPYARAARITAIESGLEEQLELIWTDPWNADARLLAANPAGKVPVLITGDGVALSECLLICLHVQASGSQGDGGMPPASALQLAGLGQELLDAAFGTVIARKYQGNEQDQSFLGERRLAALGRLLAHLDNVPALDDEAPDFSHFMVGVGLDYLLFRLPEIDWSARTRLVRFHQRLASRPSFASTPFA